MTENFFRCHVDFEAFDHATPHRLILQTVRSRELGAFSLSSAESWQDLRRAPASRIGEIARATLVI
jgi:hypothetical protein